MLAISFESNRLSSTDNTFDKAAKARSFENDSKTLRAEKKTSEEIETERDMPPRRRRRSKKKEREKLQKNSDNASLKPLTKFQCLRFVTNSFSVGTQDAIVASASTSSTKIPVVDAETPRGRWSTEIVAAIVSSLFFLRVFPRARSFSFVFFLN